MINVQLTNFVNEQLSKGLTKEQIVSSLISNGWPQADIDDCFNSILSSAPSVTTNIPSPITATTNTTIISPVLSTSNSSANIQTSYAGFWLRFSAFIVDYFIINFIRIALLLVSLFLLKNTVVADLLFIIVILLYFPYAESHSGSSYGKKLMGIKVESYIGQRISFWQSLGRSVSKILSTITFMTGFIIAGFTEKKQGLHDIIAKCVVVKNEEVHIGRKFALLIFALIGITFLSWTQFWIMAYQASIVNSI